MGQEQALEMSTKLICRDAREERLLRAMYGKSKVKQRRTCVPYSIAYEWIDPDAPGSSSAGPTTKERMDLYAQHARPLAESAARQALDDASVASDEITHLVTVSCTGFDAPGVDIHLFDKLGLRRDAQRVHVGFMGCHGAINGLRTAQAIATADPKAKVLLVAVELCSLHFKFQWDPERMLGNALFADGAAALVLGNGAGSEDGLCALEATGSCLLDDSREAITWHIGDAGFDMSLSPRVPKLISEQLKPWLGRWVADHGVPLADVSGWAVHPGGPKILDAVETCLDLAPEDLAFSRAVLEQHGNMSSPTVLFLVEKFRQQQKPRPWLALGFGPGLMAEVALMT